MYKALHLWTTNLIHSLAYPVFEEAKTCNEMPGSMKRGSTSPDRCGRWCKDNKPEKEKNPLQLFDLYLPTTGQNGLPECRCFYKEEDSCATIFNHFGTIYYAGQSSFHVTLCFYLRALSAYIILTILLMTYYPLVSYWSNSSVLIGW